MAARYDQKSFTPKFVAHERPSVLPYLTPNVQVFAPTDGALVINDECSEDLPWTHLRWSPRCCLFACGGGITTKWRGTKPAKGSEIWP